MTPDVLRMAADPVEFRRHLLIDTDSGPSRLGDNLDVWQGDDFLALDPAWRRLVGQEARGGCRRAYLERPRGHSKTTDFAVMATWALLASRRKLAGVAAAGDLDQARLLRDAMDRLVRVNTWLPEFLDVQNYLVRNRHTGSELQILASDADTSYGLTPDFVLADELAHWKSEDLWISLFSAAAKRRDCLLVVISNAGRGRGKAWQWRVREAARTGDDWHFRRLDGPVASWITPDRLEEQRRILPPKAFARLWLNQWQTEAGDAFDEADIRACITAPGPLTVADRRYQGWGAGLDLGATRDHAALVVVGLDYAVRRIRVAHVQNWKPNPTVDFEAIFQAILWSRDTFGVRHVAFDPWQCLAMSQRLEREGMFMEPILPVGHNLNRMATAMLEVFRDRQIELYPDDQLVNDLLRLSIVEKQYGFKLEATRDESGHCDRATALALVLPSAREAVSAPYGQSPDVRIEQLILD